VAGSGVVGRVESIHRARAIEMKPLHAPFATYSTRPSGEDVPNRRSLLVKDHLPLCVAFFGAGESCVLGEGRTRTTTVSKYSKKSKSKSYKRATKKFFNQDTPQSTGFQPARSPREFAETRSCCSESAHRVRVNGSSIHKSNTRNNSASHKRVH